MKWRKRGTSDSRDGFVLFWLIYFEPIELERSLLCHPDYSNLLCLHVACLPNPLPILPSLSKPICGIFFCILSCSSTLSTSCSACPCSKDTRLKKNKFFDYKQEAFKMGCKDQKNYRPMFTIAESIRCWLAGFKVLTMSAASRAVSSGSLNAYHVRSQYIFLVST